jgi:hypothetical protein
MADLEAFPPCRKNQVLKKELENILKEICPRNFDNLVFASLSLDPVMVLESTIIQILKISEYFFGYACKYSV